MSWILPLLFAVLLTGCFGYQPVSSYSKEVLGEKIYIDLAINVHDPESSVLLKNVLSQAVMEQFHGKLSQRDEADSVIRISLDSVSFSSLATGSEGFTTFYRARVSLKFVYQDKNGGSGRVSTVGKYDFSTDNSSVLTDSKRLEAIRSASAQALDQFIAEITMEGATKKDVQP